MNVTPPRLPDPSDTVSPAYMVGLLRILRLFFVQLAAVRPAAVTTLNIDVDALPTQADLADLRRGDVYRDTSAGDVLKIKV